LREASPCRSSQQGTDRHIPYKKLIYREKDHPRTDHGNAGRFRFALRVSAVALRESQPQASIRRSHDQGGIEIQSRLRTDMLDPTAAFLS
jgi:hypothetical protein